MDARADAAVPDAATPDAATPDAATPDAATPDAATPDAATPDAAAACATPPTGDWAGEARTSEFGSGSSDWVRSEVTWTLVTTDGCVDRFVPSGTLTTGADGEVCGDENPACDPSSSPIEPDDGDLVIDRTTVPATFRMRGVFGPRWTGIEGAFDGAVTAGGSEDSPWDIEWQFSRVDAVFEPPSDDCSEPPSDRWDATFEHAGATRATVTWVRTSTVGCRDEYEPRGIATRTAVLDGCRDVTFEPGAGEIEPGDGWLAIDRASDPARFFATGGSQWWGGWSCTRPDGTVTTQTGWIGGQWADFYGVFDGDHFGAAFAMPDGRFYGWRFTRGAAP